MLSVLIIHGFGDPKWNNKDQKLSLRHIIPFQENKVTQKCKLMFSDLKMSAEYIKVLQKTCKFTMPKLIVDIPIIVERISK